VTFYVQNGKELELDFKKAPTTSGLTPTVTKTIVIYTVTADQQRITTSTSIDKVDGEGNEGKIILEKTAFQFTGADKQNIVYKALMPSKVETITTSGPTTSYITKVTTGGADGNYAQISAADKLIGASTGQYVTVAYGQSIESAGALTSLQYGVSVVKEDESSSANAVSCTYTYYAIGMNAGSVTIETENENVSIMNGSIIVSNGNANVKATNAGSYGSPVVISYVDDAENMIAGTLSFGVVSVSGKVVFDDAFAIGKEATLTLNASADVQSGTATVNGRLILRNDYEKSHLLSVKGTGFIVAENEKLWHYDEETNEPSIVFANAGGAGYFSGQFDVNAINAIAEVKDAFSKNMIEKNQTYRMVGDTTVANQFTVEGILYIEPGVTLTITQTNTFGASITVQGQYAQIINKGTILIKTTQPFTGQKIGLRVIGGCVINEGVINASSASNAAPNDTFVVDYNAALPEGVSDGGFGFVNAGSISIGKHDTASLDDKFTNDGSISVTGSIKANALVNNGSFTVNNAKIVSADNAFTVTMNMGASFKVVSADVAQGMEIKVQNNDGANYVSVTAPTSSTETDTVRITGITVNDTSTGFTSSKMKLDLSGNIGASIPSTITTGKVNLATKGNIAVADSVTIGKGYQLDFTQATKLNVTGEATIAKDVVLKQEDPTSNDPVLSPVKLVMTVSGTVTDVDGILNGAGNDFKFVAAKYTFTTSNTTIYTNLGDAVAEAILLDVSQIDVGDDKANDKFVTVNKDLYIPEGLTVLGAYLEVDKKATIYVEAGGRFSFDKIVIQDGMIAAEDVNDIDFDDVLADVKEEDEESTKAVAMSLEVALALASSGDVIKLANTYYAANADLVIPAGVTVDATAVPNTYFVLVNSDLTVNGKLVVDQFAFIATTDDTIGITVNGYIYDKCSNGACFVNWWYNPFGVSYYETDEEDHTWFVLTTIENIQPAINVADDAKVSVEGNAKLDELTVSGREDMPAEVTFKGNVEIGVINIDDTTLVFTDGKKITTTVKDAVGSITIIGAYSDDNLNIYSMDDEGVYMAGTVIDTPDKEKVTSVNSYSIMFEGVTGINGNTRTAIDWTNGTDTPLILFNGETKVIGKKAKINTNEDNVSGLVTITKLLYVDNAAKLAINADVQITGSLVAADRTLGDLGSITTTGNIFVGMLANEIYDMNYYEPDYKPVLAGTAILSGKVSLAEKCFIYAAPDALIDPEIIEDLDGLTVYVDGEVWFLLYAYESKTFDMDGLRVPMFNAKISGIIDGYDNKITYTLKPNTTDVIDQTSSAKTLTGYGNAIYIGLNYEIFTVKIKTDGSVKAVYIDGILMETGESRNIFLMRNVVAGTHKVTVEPSAGYTADGCILYTEMETILPGMAFTFTQYDCTERIDGEDTVVYNIKGTQVEPEPVPPTPEEESQWTITTILLVILVVLIAIMAVIVALRLNRS
jgi:hypothetical protein